MAQSLDQLKAKYQSVLAAIQQVNGSLKNVHIEGEKLLIRAEVANDQLKNKIWDQIKQVDPGYSDLTADITINSSLQAPAEPEASKTYTVKSGDTLSKIAQQFYGSAAKYPKIFDANRDQLSNPDKIQVGMELKIPA